MAIKKIAFGIEIDSIVKFAGMKEHFDRNQEVYNQFKRTATALREAQGKVSKGKRVAPKTKDFTYGHAIMMTAAEGSLIDQNTGDPIKNVKGETAKGWFEEAEDHRGNKTVKWVSPDDILPYKNSNGDIFPEEDLIAKHKDWIGKPLCKDHISDSVDGIRGIVVDTYYDPKFKRVHALFALDKKNYPDLARKVEAGYATSVSMGTAVGRSICTECFNVATTEAEYCHHVRTKSCYGEVNKDLSPIELSVVVTGADPQAKIKTVLASMQDYVEKKERQLAKMSKASQVSENEVATLDREITSLAEQVKELDGDFIDSVQEVIEDLRSFVPESEAVAVYKDKIGKVLDKDKLHQIEKPMVRELANALKHHGHQLREEAELVSNVLASYPDNEALHTGLNDEDQTGLGNAGLTDDDGYPLGQGDQGKGEYEMKGYGPMPGDLMPGDRMMGGATPPAAFSFSNPQMSKEANVKDVIAELEGKIEKMQKHFKEIRANMKEKTMFEKLKERASQRKDAYHQGTEPHQKYERMTPPDQDEVRAKEDKQMVGDELDTTPNKNPDMDKKELLQRASDEGLEARKAWRKQVLENIKEAMGGSQEYKDPMTGKKYMKTDQGKLLEQAAKDKDEDDKEKDDKKDDEKDDKKDKDKDDKKKDDDKEDKKDKDKSEKDDDKLDDKKAYHQGTEPHQKYPLMGDQEALRANEDKQMKQTDNLGGNDGMVPGDEQTKREMQRMAKLSAGLYKGASANESCWKFYRGNDVVMTMKAASVYGDMLTKKASADLTFGDYFQSADYAKRVISRIKEEGVKKVADELGGELPAPAAPMPAENDLDAGKDLGDAAEDLKEGDDLKDKVDDALSAMEGLIEKLRGDLDLKALDSAEVEMPEPEGLPGPVATKDKNLLEAYSVANDLADELTFVGASLEVGDKDKGLVSRASEAVADAREVVATTQKYLKTQKKTAKTQDNELKVKAAKLDEILRLRAERRKQWVKQAEKNIGKEAEASVVVAEDDLSTTERKEVEDIAEDEAEEAKKDHETEMHAFDSYAKGKTDLDKKARSEWRKQMVAKAMGTMKYDDVYESTRSGGGANLDFGAVKPGDELNKVETTAENASKHLEVATKDFSDSNVRMAADKLDKMFKTAGVKVTDELLQKMIAEGAADAEAVAYWKQFYGEAPESSDFGALMSKEWDSHKKEAQVKQASAGDDETLRVKLDRAYQVAMDAQSKGLVPNGRASLSAYAQKLSQLPDDWFENVKRLVDQTNKPGKVATASAPQVGLQNNDYAPGIEKNAGAEPSYENLASLFLK